MLLITDKGYTIPARTSAAFADLGIIALSIGAAQSVVVTHGDENGNMLHAARVDKYIAQHPDDNIVIICCFPNVVRDSGMVSEAIAKRIIGYWDTSGYVRFCEHYIEFAPYDA